MDCVDPVKAMHLLICSYKRVKGRSHSLCLGCGARRKFPLYRKVCKGLAMQMTSFALFVE